MSKPTLYLVPRWAGSIHTDWYNWLIREIELKYNISITCLEMPDWQNPEIESSLNFLLNNIPELNENTFFIGHSVGCQSILHYLNNMFDQNNQLFVGGFLFVSGWFEVDKPWITLKPWLQPTEMNYNRIANNVGYRKVILSDNDPFTIDFKRNEALWETKLKANVEIYPNRLHFNNSIEMDILVEVEIMLQAME